MMRLNKYKVVNFVKSCKINDRKENFVYLTWVKFKVKFIQNNSVVLLYLS